MSRPENRREEEQLRDLKKKIQEARRLKAELEQTIHRMDALLKKPGRSSRRPKPEI